ncbi:6,7-dimethyl-8-ribityllumazine synthase [Trifolium repens]|nr:6,7-dimethyl-8-ribityllumazine synthase [Trifolium repens]
MTLFSSLQITTTFHSLNPSSTILHKSLLPRFSPSISLTKKSRTTTTTTITRASLLETPVLWVGRICIFYALLKTGFVGSPSNPLLSDLEISDGESNESGDLGFSKWTQSILGKPAKEVANGANLTSKWHPTTKGTLRRNYRVPSKSEGRRLLKSIASLLSDDDHFVDATSHKGCQIRRESAHGESVCCNNVRALFDELPTPHLIVEITPFPAGPLSDNDYTKAEKLERVLRSSPSV